MRRFPAFLILFASLILNQSASAQSIDKISPEEFTKIIHSISEPGGYYRSDVWITNETAYLDVIKPLKDNEIAGGAYIGVAPNQNFAYIAAIKPEIAFILDIRHQNRMQHLMYKIMFELADSRAEFFSLLFARPLDQVNAPGKNANINQIVDYFYSSESSVEFFNQTQNKIIDILETKYKYPLNNQDKSELNYVMTAFYTQNLNINSGGRNRRGRGGRGGRRPSFADVLRTKDLEGKQSNPFNSKEEFLYLKNMHLANKIIPITGNFAGETALTNLANYLKDKKLTVSAYYLSNVEQYLFQDGIFGDWAENVKKLPTNDKSVFIRALLRDFRTTKLQWIKDFIKNYDAGNYRSYYDLAILDYIDR